MDPKRQLKRHDEVTMSSSDPNAPALTFPCEFPIKAMGLSSEGLDLEIMAIIRKHVADVSEGALVKRPSRHGKYTSVTVTIEATSQAQLDAIYRELSACERIIMAL